jgi:hypothetical protein
MRKGETRDVLAPEGEIIGELAAGHRDDTRSNENSLPEEVSDMLRK